MGVSGRELNPAPPQRKAWPWRMTDVGMPSDQECGSGWPQRRHSMGKGLTRGPEVCREWALGGLRGAKSRRAPLARAVSSKFILEEYLW